MRRVVVATVVAEEHTEVLAAAEEHTEGLAAAEMDDGVGESSEDESSSSHCHCSSPSRWLC